MFSAAESTQLEEQSAEVMAFFNNQHLFLYSCPITSSFELDQRTNEINVFNNVILNRHNINNKQELKNALELFPCLASKLNASELSIIHKDLSIQFESPSEVAFLIHPDAWCHLGYPMYASKPRASHTPTPLESIPALLAEKKREHDKRFGAISKLDDKYVIEFHVTPACIPTLLRRGDILGVVFQPELDREKNNPLLSQAQKALGISRLLKIPVFTYFPFLEPRLTPIPTSQLLEFAQNKNLLQLLQPYYDFLHQNNKEGRIKPFGTRPIRAFEILKEVKVSPAAESKLQTSVEYEIEIKTEFPLLSPELLAKAEKGDAAAQYEVGKHYLTTISDISIGLGWLLKSAERDHTEAQVLVGQVCLHIARKSPHPTGITIGLHWTRTAFIKGSLGAQYNLGLYYLHGFVPGKTANDGFELFKSVADKCKNVAEMQHAVGMSYLTGKGTALNLVQAKKYLLAAANLGHSNAQYELGLLYDHHKIKKEAGKSYMQSAIEWYEKAVAQHHVKASYELGYLYIIKRNQGKGSDECYKEGLRLLGFAGAHDNKEARLLLEDVKLSLKTMKHSPSLGSAATIHKEKVTPAEKKLPLSSPSTLPLPKPSRATKAKSLQSEDKISHEELARNLVLLKNGCAAYNTLYLQLKSQVDEMAAHTNTKISDRWKVNQVELELSANKVKKMKIETDLVNYAKLEKSVDTKKVGDADKDSRKKTDNLTSERYYLEQLLIKLEAEKVELDKAQKAKQNKPLSANAAKAEGIKSLLERRAAAKKEAKANAKTKSKPKKAASTITSASSDGFFTFRGLDVEPEPIAFEPKKDIKKEVKIEVVYAGDAKEVERAFALPPQPPKPPAPKVAVSAPATPPTRRYREAKAKRLLDCIIRYVVSMSFTSPMVIQEVEAKDAQPLTATKKELQDQINLYCLLYQIMRLFEGFKKYNQAGHETPFSPDSISEDMRNLIMHSADHVEAIKDNIFTTAALLLAHLPKELQSLKNRWDEPAISDVQRISLNTLLTFGEITTDDAADEAFELEVNKTPLYIKLAEFHEAKTSVDIPESKRIEIVSRLLFLIDEIFIKIEKSGPTPMSQRAIEKFNMGCLSEINAVKMLLTMCGELYGKDWREEKNIVLQEFWRDCRRIRNDVGHKFDSKENTVSEYDVSIYRIYDICHRIRNIPRPLLLSALATPEKQPKIGITWFGKNVDNIPVFKTESEVSPVERPTMSAMP